MDDTVPQASTQQVQSPSQPTVAGRQMEPPVARPVAAPAATNAATDTVPAPVGSHHPEQGPIATAASVEDSQPVVAQESHPPVEVSAEMKDAGVAQGADAKVHALPEEVKKIGVELAKEATPVLPQQTPPAHVDKSYEELLVEAKTTKSSKDASSWSLREMIRAWKRQIFAETGEVPKAK